MWFHFKSLPLLGNLHWIGLRVYRVYRKYSYLMVETMVSGRFSDFPYFKVETIVSGPFFPKKTTPIGRPLEQTIWRSWSQRGAENIYPLGDIMII